MTCQVQVQNTGWTLTIRYVVVVVKVKVDVLVNIKIYFFFIKMPWRDPRYIDITFLAIYLMTNVMNSNVENNN